MGKIDRTRHFKTLSTMHPPSKSKKINPPLLSFKDACELFEVKKAVLVNLLSRDGAPSARFRFRSNSYYVKSEMVAWWAEVRGEK